MLFGHLYYENYKCEATTILSGAGQKMWFEGFFFNQTVIFLIYLYQIFPVADRISKDGRLFSLKTIESGHSERLWLIETSS